MAQSSLVLFFLAMKQFQLPALALLTALTLSAQVPMQPADLIARNLGPIERVNDPFPPHKVIGNIYFVGPQALGTFLIVTPAGLILMNSYKFSDIKILLGSHAHGDHMEGDAMVKELTGAQVMAMAEDVPALQAMKPGGKAHPIDRILHDGDTVSLGGTTLTAHLTPGHTKGCTTWTMTAQENGKSYNVVFVGSSGVNPGVQLVNNKDYPNIAEDFRHTFDVLRSLPCDVPLGSHPGMYNMAAKFAKQGQGVNPYIDPEGYRIEIDINDAVYWRVLAEQRAKAGLPPR
jgi:metallo-beta-lactamase class B